MRGSDILRGLGIGAALLVVLILLALTLINLPAGQRLLADTIGRASGGSVALIGLSGRVPDSLRAERIEIKDATGTWLTAENLALRWSPIQLLAGHWEVQSLTATSVSVVRKPVSAAGAEASSRPPLRALVQRVAVDRLELAAAVTGRPAVLTLEGGAQIDWPAGARLELAIRRLDGEGEYRIQAHYEPGGADLQLSLAEAGDGPAAALAGLPDLGRLRLQANAHGPRDDLRFAASLEGGPLRGTAQGKLDLERKTSDLEVSLTAPAMAPSPQLSWTALRLDGRCSGPWQRPSIDAKLTWDNPKIAGSSATQLTANLQGDAGQLDLHGRLDGLRMPGRQPDLFADQPLEFAAELRPDQAGVPARFSLRHPLLELRGEGRAAGDWDGTAELILPRLAPLAPLAGLELAGAGSLQLDAHQADGGTELKLQGALTVTGGSGPWPGLLGPKGSFSGSTTIQPGRIALADVNVNSQALSLSTAGTLATGAADLRWQLDLTDLAPLGLGSGGHLNGQGRLQGPFDNLAVHAQLQGQGSSVGPLGPATAQLELEGLPRATRGRLDAQVALAGSPLNLAVAMEGGSDRQSRLTVEQARWRSASIQGALALPTRSADLPEGRLNLTVERLQDLQGLAGPPVSGRLDGHLELTRNSATLNLTANRAGLASRLAADRSELHLTVADPLDRAALSGDLSLDGLATGELAGSARLGLKGSWNRPEFQLLADLQHAGTPIRTEAEAVFDRRRPSLTLTRLETGWDPLTLRLAEPATLELADGTVLRRTRLQALGTDFVLAGRLQPALDLALDGEKLPASSLLKPWVDADGRLDLHARLQGALAQPSGDLRLDGSALRLRQEPWSILPATDLALSAQWDGAAARVDGHLRAAQQLRVEASGDIPLIASGTMNLNGRGNADLRLLDPLLAAHGERLRGQLSFRGQASGTLENPRYGGQARIDGGEFHDDLIGTHVVAVSGSAQSGAGEVWNLALKGRAGPGPVALNGSFRPTEPGIPVDLSLTARKAEPVASDRLTVKLDADLGLRGPLDRAPNATGQIRISQAEIRVPERLPANIAELRLEEAGAAPPPAVKTRPLALDLSVSAPHRIHVRGRGLDVELGGDLRLKGNLAAPRPQGRFNLIRGSYSLAGRTLDFSRGELGFNGDDFTDPTLDFVATSNGGGITASLAVTGTAGKPKISLSSTPELPPDEILARLLFGRAIASLSPFELAQIAGSAASLTGIVPDSGNPLERLRTSLGLDRLAVGSGTGGSPTLEGGRYVAPGVYVGSRQALNGSGGTQATVQVDVAKGLKLEGGIGTPSPPATGTGAGSIGVIYQFEY